MEAIYSFKIIVLIFSKTNVEFSKIYALRQCHIVIVSLNITLIFPTASTQHHYIVQTYKIVYFSSTNAERRRWVDWNEKKCYETKTRNSVDSLVSSAYFPINCPIHCPLTWEIHTSLYRSDADD